MICIALTTCRKYAYPPKAERFHAQFNRMETVLDTWWPDTEKTDGVFGRIMVGGDEAEPAQFGLHPADVQLDCPDDYRGLAIKTLRACAWCYNNGVEFMVRSDDDTAMDVEGVRDWILRTRPDYGGLKLGDCIHGGTGIVFSRKAMKIMAGATWHPVYKLADDIWFAGVLKKAGVSLYTDSEFASLTKHCKTSEEMRNFYAGISERRNQRSQFANA